MSSNIVRMIPGTNDGTYDFPVPIRVYPNEFDFERLILTFFHTGTYGCIFLDGLQRIYNLHWLQ